MLFMGSPQGMGSQVEFPKVPVIDIAKANKAAPGMVSLTPSN